MCEYTRVYMCVYLCTRGCIWERSMLSFFLLPDVYKRWSMLKEREVRYKRDGEIDR